MTTARDLITSSLKTAGVLGVGQSALAEDINDSLETLNSMIAQWARRRWLVYHLVDVAWQADGSLSYSIGAGGDLDYARPDSVESAFFRQTVSNPANPVDYPLTVLTSREDYNRISLKNLASFPSVLFYDSGYPLGYIYVWPIPSNLYQIHVSLKATLPSFANLSDSVTLPPEYSEAIKLNLAVRMKVMYQLPADPVLNALAKKSVDTIKNANAQIPTLKMPNGLMGTGRYNIFSDRIEG